MPDTYNRDDVARFRVFYEEVANKGKLDRIDDLVAEDFVEHEEFPGLKPNREGLRDFFAMMQGAFPDLNIAVEYMVADEDKIVAYTTLSGTHKGPFFGVPATGKAVQVKEIDIVRMRDGKMVEHWGVADMLTLMDQIGALPAMDS